MIGNLEYICLPIVYIYQLKEKKSHYYDKLFECASFIELLNDRFWVKRLDQLSKCTNVQWSSIYW